jgi:hypothetical protein
MSQLFKKNPHPELFSKIIKSLGIDEYKEDFSFRKKDLISLNTVEKIKALDHELRECYFPCKSKLYLDNLNETKCITIIRQFLRQFGYNLISKEKYLNGEKFIVYSLSASHQIKSVKNKIINLNI